MTERRRALLFALGSLAAFQLIGGFAWIGGFLAAFDLLEHGPRRFNSTDRTRADRPSETRRIGAQSESSAPDSSTAKRSGGKEILFVLVLGLYGLLALVDPAQAGSLIQFYQWAAIR